MIHLQTLGPTGLRDGEGREIVSVLAQPKRLALLVYLAIAGPGRLRRRDILVSIFWPEQDADRARGALRQALRFLRNELGRKTLMSRGDEEVGVDPAGLRCDAGEFDAACDRKAWSEALDLYTGNLLEGFFLPGVAPEFERWLDGERGKFRQRAVQAAWALVDAAESAGDRVGAVPLARRAAALSPDDEAGVRRLLRILDRRGDRAGALAAYEEFRHRLAAEYGVSPAPETEAVIAAIRSRQEKIWESPLRGWAPAVEELPAEPGRLVEFGRASAEYVAIRVLSRSEATEFWDGNWLECAIGLQIGGFRGDYVASFPTTEFDAFHRQLQALHASLSGTARFEPMEEQLTLTLEGDGRGHISVRGRAQDVAGTGSVLQFSLDFDQTELSVVIKQVAELLQRYPVRGAPAA